MKRDPHRRRSPRLVCIATHAVTAKNLMRGQLAYLRERGFETILITAPGSDLDAVSQREQVEAVPVAMQRNISPWQDLKSLIAMCRAIRRLRPDIVNAGTPKAALLGMLAAWLCGVPVRVYTLRGLRLETAKGATLGLVLNLVERLTSWCSTQVLCVSGSLRDAYVQRGLATREKTKVLGSGSSNGIDPGRFSAGPRLSVAALRERYGIRPAAPVIGFVGRLTHDKGICELFEAFERLLPEFPDLRLVLVGGFEAGDALPEELVGRLCVHPQVIRPGFVDETADFYRMFDLLAFPSHREGFPNAPLEAAAAGLPVVGFRATGTVDAVEEGVTGTLVPCGNVSALTAAARRYLDDRQLAQQHGAAGRERVAREFPQEKLWNELALLYHDLLHERKLLHTAVSSSFETDGASAKAGNESALGLPRLAPPAVHRWKPRASFYARHGKRILDVSLAIAAMALLSPLLFCTALLVRAKLGVPVLFRQQRPGRFGVPFLVRKFRTMTDARDAEGRLLPDDERLPALGRWLRSTSLDELPELWNVVRGDMSLVGPRPLMMQYVERYTPEQFRRHEVRPGLTGWSQINGRNSLDWEEKFRLDVWYADNVSLWLDLKILFLTPWAVLKREGISAGDHATMPEFLGTRVASDSKLPRYEPALRKAA